ncbi:hypothetical protein OSB04_013324 [Centaurea solstitialis]|uniref:S-protein homolog n=1 Tax=Centaurea solstitialis TaxID=347529 RepID=A0AA38WN95_9ASTR|nr:hypothetical protein OSB04_013324 [Centaurea solstitialis]
MEKPFSFFFFTTFLCIIISVADSCTFTQGYSVIIGNDNIRDESVSVSCNSKDDHINGKALKFNETMAWSFCESPSTRFTCKFDYPRWQYQHFDVFNKNIKGECKEPNKERYRCTWSIRKDGFYFINRVNGRRDIKKYDWLTRPHSKRRGSP